MRPRVIACAVVAVLVAAAAPVWASGRSIGLPTRAVIVNVPLPTPDAPRPVRAAESGPATRPATPLPPAGPAKALPVASKPSDLIRVVFTLKAGDAPHAVAGGVCPAAATCKIFGLSGYRFKTDPSGTAVVNYKYNDANRRDLRSPDPATVRSAIRAAAATWHHWNSNVVMNDTGDTTATFGAVGKDGTCADGVNSIGWGRFDSPDDVGVAGMCLDKTQHVIRDADIMLNISFWWSNGGNSRRQTYDVQDIVTHEMGHWLSLTDQYSSTASSQTMFGSANFNETRKRTLALGDISAVQAAYPCLSGDSCPRSGITND